MPRGTGKGGRPKRKLGNNGEPGDAPRPPPKPKQPPKPKPILRAKTTRVTQHWRSGAAAMDPGLRTFMTIDDDDGPVTRWGGVDMHGRIFREMYAADRLRKRS